MERNLREKYFSNLGKVIATRYLKRINWKSFVNAFANPDFPRTYLKLPDRQVTH
jgi:hypothetical protein